MVKNGIGYLSEDRKQFGLLLDKDLSFNTGMAAMDHSRTHRSLRQRNWRAAAQTTW